jgi:hypothetical protein
VLSASPCLLLNECLSLLLQGGAITAAVDFNLQGGAINADSGANVEIHVCTFQQNNAGYVSVKPLF